tara:strand:+ start:1954 stop:6258 length:4305 start_codon:yes stop_codon:yes gene_type:complete
MIEQERWLRRAKERMGVRLREGIHEAIEIAGKTAQPHGGLGAQLLENIDPGMNPVQMVRDVQASVRGSSSFYMPRFASAFMREMGTFSSVMKQGQYSGMETVDQIRGVPDKTDPFFYQKSKVRSTLSITPSKTGASQIASLQSAMGADRYELVRQSRKDKMAGSQLRLRFFKGDERLAQMNVPETMKGMPGVVSRGHYQQSRYIAGQYGIVQGGKITSTFNHTQWMMLRASEDLAPQIASLPVKSKDEIRRLVRGFEGQMNEPLDWARYAPDGQWDAGEEYMRTRSDILRLRTPEGLPLSAKDYTRMVGSTYKGQTLDPPYSASQAADTVVARGGAAGRASVFGKFSQFARKPLQWFRPDYQLSAGARDAIAADPTQATYQWAAANQRLDSPMMRIAYVAPGANMHLRGVTEEGMGVVSEQADAMRQVEKLTTVDISRTTVGADLDKILDRAGRPTQITGKELMDLTGDMPEWDAIRQGGFVGRDSQGNPMRVDLGKQRLLDIAMFGEDANKGRFFRMTLAEQLAPAQVEKNYLAAKQMSWRVSRGEMDVMRGHLGVGDDVMAIASMDVLKKNRREFLNQVFTELQRTTTERMHSHGVSQRAYDFTQNAGKAIEKMMGGLSGTPGQQMDSMIGHAWEIAQGAELSTKQLGQTFAAVPHVMGDDWASNLPGITGAQRAAITSSQVSVGMGQLFHGGSPLEGMGGAGRVATVEPRAFELFGTPQWGELGGRAQRDIAERLIRANPLAMSEQGVLGDSLRSVLQPGEIQGSMSLSKYQEKAGKGGLLAGDQAVRISGFGDVMIPGTQSIRQMEERKKLHMSEKQLGTSSDLAKSYKKLLDQGALLEDKTINAESFQRVAGNLSSDIGEAYAATVNKGILRGRLPGSMFMSAVTPKSGQNLGRGVVGISGQYANKMFEGLSETGMYSADAIEGMRDRFFGGKTIGGVVGRHPYIGQYSSQAVEFKLAKGIDDPIAIFGEDIMEVSTVKGSSGSVLENQRVRLSPLVGLAGDTDGDAISATFAGPNMERDMRRKAQDLMSRQELEAFEIRNQILKAKKPPGAGSFIEELAGSAVKMGAPETSLGKLSNLLTRSKAAVLASHMGRAETMDAMHLLEWFEQGPISGKHIPDKDALKMLTMFEQLETGLKHSDSRLLRNTARQIIGQGNDIASQLFSGQGMDVRMRNTIPDAPTPKWWVPNQVPRKAAPESVPRHIPGLNLERTLDNVMNATASYDDLGGAEARGLQLGKQGMTPTGAGKMLDRGFMSKTIFGSLFQSVAGVTPEGAFESFSKRAVGTINRTISAGGRVLGHAKPVGMGIAAAIGISAVLSSPRASLDPGSKNPPRPNMRVNSGGNKVLENIGGPRYVGTPTAPSPTGAANTARVSPPGHNIVVRGNAARPVDYNSLSSSIGSVTGGSVNVSVRDQRKSLTPEKLAQIMREG